MAAIGSLLCAFAQAAGATSSSELAAVCRDGQTPMSRVDLFFGAGHVDSSAWRRFLSSVVTPRFPEGLTSYDGRGQWRGSRGLQKERAHILVIYYKPTADANANIEAIRTAYKRRFWQSSVLRADSSACVSF